MGMRNIYISAAVMAGVLFPGGLLFRDAGIVAHVAVLVVAFVASLAVLHALDDRQLRRK
jgi:hypothetical protein